MSVRLPRLSRLLIPLLCLALFGCARKEEAASNEATKAGAYSISQQDAQRIAELYPQAIETPTGLRYLVLQEGRGEAKPRHGAVVKVNYELRLLGGPVIESSQATLGGPLAFQVGIGRVIRGWDEALLDMKQGERRTLIIPHFLGYGVTGSPPKIPPYATLVFDVELASF